MDTTSEGAVLDVFRIGPGTAAGRAFAIQILFCRDLKERLHLLTAALGRGIGWVRIWARYLLKLVLRVVNPRKPGVILATVIGAMLLLRRANFMRTRAEQTYRRKFWSNMMKSATTYEEWAHSAMMMEKAMNRRRDEDMFDEDLVKARLNELRLRRLHGGVGDILFFLRADLVRNLGNMCNPDLHKGRLQVPRLIQEYTNEVRYHLRAVCDRDSDEFPTDEKIAFINETRHAFGRTALLLSGGAALGAFHLGVVRTLIEHRLLPRVVAGASVGSITCSFTATRTWQELEKFFDNPIPPMNFFESMGSIIATTNRLLTKGSLYDIGSLQRQMRQLIGDLTFQEAYDISGRVLAISVCSPRKHEPPRCLNYLTSPHVVIWSAVTASCAFPGLFPSQELMAKDRTGRIVSLGCLTKEAEHEQGSPTSSVIGREGDPGMKQGKNMVRYWRDGSLESDLPMTQLKELFNVNHFIVSQANPHIAPLLRVKEITRAYGGDFAAKLAHLVEMEVKHRCNQALAMKCELWGLAKLFAQEWEGDVTIVMPATFEQFTKIIQNPTAMGLRKALMQGRRCTWEKLSAIQANCGIELMLDECVTELNHRRKMQKETRNSSIGKSSYERNAQDGNRLIRRSIAKRIPSWNIIARDSSFGSLDEEIDHVRAGGPWGGPSLGKLKNRQNSSDSDSGAESQETISWATMGGPLMKSASAVRIAACRSSDVDISELAETAASNRELVYVDSEHDQSLAHQDGDDAGEGSGRGYESSSPILFSPLRRGEYSSGKLANKMYTRSGKVGCHQKRLEDSCSAEEQDLSVRGDRAMHKSSKSELRTPTSTSTSHGDGESSASEATQSTPSDVSKDSGPDSEDPETGLRKEGSSKGGVNCDGDILSSTPRAPAIQNPQNNEEDVGHRPNLSSGDGEVVEAATEGSSQISTSASTGPDLDFGTHDGSEANR